MLAAHVCKSAVGRLKNRTEVFKLAEVVCPYLDHREVVPGMKPEQRPRHADVVVQVSLGAQHRIARLENLCDHFLGCRFSVTPGDGQKRNIEFLPVDIGQPAVRLCRVVHDQKRAMTVGTNIGPPVHHRTRGTAAERPFDELMAVEALSPDCKEELSGPHRARVCRYARKRPAVQTVDVPHRRMPDAEKVLQRQAHAFDCTKESTISRSLKWIFLSPMT